MLLSRRQCLKRGEGERGREKEREKERERDRWRDRVRDEERVRGESESETARARGESCTDGPDAVTDWHADTHFLFAAHNLPNDA